MLKRSGLARHIGLVVKEATGSTLRRVLRQYDEVNGREEENTAQIKSEITFHLMDEIYQLLDGKIGGRL